MTVSPAETGALTDSSEFDPDWYAKHYPDVTQLGLDPLEHFLRIGKRIGRLPCPKAAGLSEDPRRRPSFERFGIIAHNPLISIVVVSFNSGADLKILFPSIAAQTYRNFEVVLVENGDEDTRPLLDQFFERTHYLNCDNVGFAEANNVAVAASNGELLALVNPDTRLAPEALQSLLDALRYDESAAVAVPKINFFERFVRIELVGNAPFSVPREDLLRGLAYKKMFVRAGIANDDRISSTEEGLLSVDLPYEGERTINLRIDGSARLDRLESRVGYSEKQYFMSDDLSLEAVQILLNAENCSSARYLVNNAGSSLHADGSPYDRGFAQFDDGVFYSKSYVDAFCGCAALIRRTAILQRDLFVGPFFAYYEDSELSYWLREQGHRILYQPEAQVFHRHSESTEELSLVWSVLVARSKRLYDWLTSSDCRPLNAFGYDYPAEFDGPLRNRLAEFDTQIRNSNTRRDLVRPKRPTACVYNTYFSSMGGGEKHALDLASMLRDHYDVYLVSERDFDLERLEKYFSVDLKGVRKLVVTVVDSWFTSNFDMFVNSTFRSNLIPSALENIYIVSFPHADIERNVVSSYHFFHNSSFTAYWARELWGYHRFETVLPILGEYKALRLDLHRDSKKDDIISVGRFTYDGHCKNHHLVLDAYKQMVGARPELSKWRLRILGSCDHASESATEYLRDLRQAAKGYNIEVLPNVDREILDAAYTDASIYVHATGLSVPKENPEFHEHFGITAFEALAHGCLPVVYQYGGPAAQVEGLPVSKLFGDRSSLQQALESAINAWEGDWIRPDEIQDYARAMHAKNQQFAERLLSGLASCTRAAPSGAL